MVSSEDSPRHPRAESCGGGGPGGRRATNLLGLSPFAGRAGPARAPGSPRPHCKYTDAWEGERQEAGCGEQAIKPAEKAPLSSNPGGAAIAGQISLGGGLREDSPTVWPQVHYLSSLSPLLAACPSLWKVV